ncbi:MAG TPA: phosphoribosyltransferase family protein [Xanthobacteraceae bacterium]|nr:phosphoribosyltransferase family protein [Xanthobacteraceae bacterium]
MRAAEWSHIGLSNGSRRRRSRSGSISPSEPKTCRAPFVCQRPAGPEVVGRRLLLIDDVLTSGATVNACARALLRAGATCGDVLVFARVVAGSRAPI